MPPKSPLAISSDDLWENQQKLPPGASFVGCDEAGRGPLAGPVLCAAVYLEPKHHFPLLRDSKKISAKTRNTLFAQIQAEVEHFAIVSLSAAEIDQMNILAASLEGMKRAVENLKLPQIIPVVDGSQLLRNWLGEQYTLIKGDDKLACIAAASILAKVKRDLIMEEIHEEFPMYGFDKHKGYPTIEHRQAIDKYGPCPYHRLSFSPLKQMNLFASLEFP